jgi:hypothetical protein
MRAALALGAATWVLVAVAVFFGGGADDGPLFGIGTGALVLVAAATGAVLLGVLPRPRLGRTGAAALVSLAAFVAWNGISIAWSIEPSQSWDYFNRGVVYFAFACLGVLVGGALPRAVRATAFALAALLAALLLWTLLAKVVAPIERDYGRIARLRGPVEYWNALALLADGAVVLALWVAERLRVAGALLLYVALVACVLTYSRFGIVLGVLGGVAWIALRRQLAPVVAAIPPAAAVLAFGLTRPGIADDGVRYSTRVRDGALFAVAVVAGALLVALATRLALPRVRVARAGRIVAVVAVVAVGSFVGATAQARWHEFCPPESQQLSQEQARLGSFNSSNRCRWWRKSVDVFADSPGGGSGAGTFQLADRVRRGGNVSTIEPHNTALQFLGETGIVGFALWLAFFVSVVLALRRRAWRDGDAALALTLVTAIFFGHSLGDMDWSFVAVTAPFMTVIGVLLAGDREAVLAPRRHLLAALGIAFASLALVYSLFSPWFAQRRLNSAIDAIAAFDLRQALDDARSARSFDPLSVDAVLTEASTLEAAGDLAAARPLYEKATDLEPENPDAWYARGVFELDAKRPRAAYYSLNRSYTLDPFGPAALQCGPLDRARYLAFGELPKGVSCPGLKRRARP